MVFNSGAESHSGRCSNCGCRKARRHCSDCLPNRMNQCENQPESSRSSPGEPALIPIAATAVSRRDADLMPLSVGSCETVDPVEPPFPISNNLNSSARPIFIGAIWTGTLSPGLLTRPMLCTGSVTSSMSPEAMQAHSLFRR